VEQPRHAAPQQHAFLEPALHSICVKASLRGQLCGRRYAPRHQAQTAAVAGVRPAVGVAGTPGLPRCFLACLSSRVAARIRASTDARLLLDPRKMAPRRHELAVIEPFNVLA
jgi:hypothetical protein